MEHPKPSKKWFALPVALFALAICIIGVSLVAFLHGLDSDRLRIDPSGTTVATFEQGGKMNIAYEYRVYSNLSRDLNLTFAFENTETGAILQSQFPRGNMTYQMNGVNGIVIATVEVEPGTYKITSDAGERLDVDIVILETSPFGMIGGFVLGILAGVFMMFGGIGAIIVIAVKRSRSRQEPVRQGEAAQTQPPVQ